MEEWFETDQTSVRKTLAHQKASIDKKASLQLAYALLTGAAGLLGPSPALRRSAAAPVLQLHASVALIAHLANLQRGRHSRHAGRQIDGESCAQARTRARDAVDAATSTNCSTHRSSPPQVYRFVEREALRATP